jgi:hypothetical protein
MLQPCGVGQILIQKAYQAWFSALFKKVPKSLSSQPFQGQHMPDPHRCNSLITSKQQVGLTYEMSDQLVNH